MMGQPCQQQTLHDATPPACTVKLCLWETAYLSGPAKPQAGEEDDDSLNESLMTVFNRPGVDTFVIY